MKIDHAKANRVLTRLYTAYIDREYPFDSKDALPPQNDANLPETLIKGTREHALFLFCLCYWMRGGIKSHTATKMLTRLYLTLPHVFLPENISSKSTEFVLTAIQSVGLTFNAEEISQHWVKNFERLSVEYGGDPRLIFQGISTFEEACARIQNKGKRGFHGFQEKMVSMIIYFYMEAKIIPTWNFPIPVDFHVLRTVFAHEILVAEPSEGNSNGFYTKPILAVVRELFQSYCSQNNVDPVRLCDAVWLHSNLLCNQHPGNQSVVGEREGRKTVLSPMEKWSVAQTATYENTCGRCSVKETCVWCIPSAEYYIGGRVTIRERRGRPPQGNLFFF